MIAIDPGPKKLTTINAINDAIKRIKGLDELEAAEGGAK